MRFVSYAQNGEDVVLWRALGDVARGFYVDVGAAYPDADSVTRAFYDRGWSGINIEPVPSMAARLGEARPRDITLAVAAGASEADTLLHVLEDTGLSTSEPEVLDSLGEAALRAKPLLVPTRRLSAILDEHAPDRIEFLKIDTEGSERAVLEGCDFQRHRPRVVLVEATWPNTGRHTHEAWEGLLAEARYRFALFDGLNRFYVADEWAWALLPSLAAPANILDNYVRADAPSAREAAGVESQLGRAMERARVAEESGRAAYARAFAQARDLGLAHVRAAGLERDRDEALLRMRSAEERLAVLAPQASTLARDLAEARRLLDATRRSNSWRLTRPLRALSSVARGRRNGPPLPGAAPEPATPPAAASLPAAAPAPIAQAQPIPAAAPIVRSAVPVRTVNQFHSGSATGDAVTNSMLLIRRELRRRGYRSEIFVEHRDPALAHELQLMQDLPQRADHLLIVHHSLGYDSIDRILAHPGPKIVYYHNITPPSLLPPDSRLPEYAELGRKQLALLRQAATAAVAASEYNAIDLRRAGFDPVWTSTLLVDIAALRAQAAAPPPRQSDDPFTVLFVGRVIETKGQADLVAAFGRFRTRLGRPARLVLAGRTDSPGTYLQTIDDRMRAEGLEAELIITGPLSDAELRAQYAAADLYVSLSLHEGFGVPLIEAIAHGVPVLAWPAGAIEHTLGGAGRLPSRNPEEVAEAMLAVAQHKAGRDALISQQQSALGRFELIRQWPAMQQALSFAGAAPARNPQVELSLAAGLRFAISGHTAGSYSLAAVNRRMALAIEAERPGRVRLIPVERNAAGLPSCASRLAARPDPQTGPELVISQHYPVLVPDPPADLATALLFWEESLLPAETIATLDANFAGVLAPSAFVAKALIDSGLTRPVQVIGQAPDLHPFEVIAASRGQQPPPGQPFTFLHVSSCFPRKGVDVLLAAYAGAFRLGDPVRLVIKGFPNPHNTVQQQVGALQRADPSAAPIEVIDQDLDEASLQDLYRQAGAMVLPTRGEGYNLPAAEAMAAGVPLIVTGMGGHMDFCGKDNARLVRFRLAPSASHLSSDHSLWAEPDVDDLRAAMCEVEEARRDPLRHSELEQRTQRARAAVRARTGCRAMVRQLERAALGAMLRPAPQPVVVAWVSSWAVRCGVAAYSQYLIGAMPRDPRVAAYLVLADDRSEASPQCRPAWRLGDPASLGRLERAITAEDPEAVVIQHQPGLISWGMLAALVASPVLAGRTVVITLHETQTMLDLLSDAERTRLCAALGGLARVIVHSLADVHRLQDLGLSANVSLVPHGVRDALPRSEPRDPGGAPLIGCYGFFLPGKGIGELIHAMALLRVQRPDARLRLVNADYGAPESKEEIARCRALAGALGLGNSVEWHTEFLPDTESLALLSSCDAIVIPTQASREGSSAAVRSALAAGPPVMVTPLPVFNDVGAAVVRASGLKATDLAATLHSLLADRQTQRAAQEAAESWLRSRVWSGIAPRFQHMLLGLLSSQGNVTAAPELSCHRGASGKVDAT